MEYRKLCKTCGHIFCFTDADIAASNQANGLSALSAIGAMAGALSGNWMAASVNQSNSHEQEHKVMDFNHCPNCHSTNLVSISDEEAKEIAAREKTATVKSSVSINANASIESIIKRIQIFIDDEEWDKAEAYCEQALDLEPENGLLYYYKLLSSHHVSNENDLAKIQDIQNDKSYKSARKYGDPDVLAILDKLDQNIKLISEEKARKERAELEKIIQKRNAEEEAERNELYDKSISVLNKQDSTLDALNCTLKNLNELKSWKYVDDDIARCKELIHKKEEKNARNKKVFGITMVVVAIVGAVVALIINVIVPGIESNNTYKSATTLMNNQKYMEAKELFDTLSSYKDASEKSQQCIYNQALIENENGNYEEAINLLDSIKDYEETAIVCDDIKTSYYKQNEEIAFTYLNEGKYYEAISYFDKTFLDDKEKYKEYCRVANELEGIKNHTNLTDLYQKVTALNGFNNSESLIDNNIYLSKIKSWEGTWKVTSQSGWGSAFDSGTLRVDIENGMGHLRYEEGARDNTDYEYVFAYLDGAMYLIDDYEINDDSYSFMYEFNPEGNKLSWYSFVCHKK